MFEILPFEIKHLNPMLDQPGNEFVSDWLKGEHAEVMLKTGSTIAVNGVPMLCGGVQKYWEGRGHVWAIFNLNSKRCFLPVFRAMKAYLKMQKIDRLETYVPTYLIKQQHRAELLGFKAEGIAKKFLTNGDDCVLYAMVRE